MGYRLVVIRQEVAEITPNNIWDNVVVMGQDVFTSENSSLILKQQMNSKLIRGLY